jgi:hypothetical protein
MQFLLDEFSRFAVDFHSVKKIRVNFSCFDTCKVGGTITSHCKIILSHCDRQEEACIIPDLFNISNQF